MKKIANIANSHYINKILNIRSKFTPSNVTHINILEKIIPKPSSKFTLPYISTKQVSKIIQKMKSSNSIGHDCSSIKLKKTK